MIGWIRKDDDRIYGCGCAPRQTIIFPLIHGALGDLPCEACGKRLKDHDDWQPLEILPPVEPTRLEAFIAGFETAGEGFNGEWHRYGPDIDDELRDRYNEWLTKSRAPASRGATEPRLR